MPKNGECFRFKKYEKKKKKKSQNIIYENF